MDYELRILVEKVAISSQKVVRRDTITSYALQCPTSIGELGLRHAEQIALLRKVQNMLLAEQSLLLAPGLPGCPTCGNTLKKNGYKTSKFHAVFSKDPRRKRRGFRRKVSVMLGESVPQTP